MKLVKQARGRWQYLLNPNEAQILRALLKRFPFAEVGVSQISKSGSQGEWPERQQLLNEALADYRQELKRSAAKLLTGGRWRKADENRLLKLDAAARDMLLRILNDVRVGCWRALGEPDPIDAPPKSKQEFAHRSLMNLAGYFEASLLEPEE